MQTTEALETKEEQKTADVVYLTDNDNMFVAPAGLSEEEVQRLSLETDRVMLQKKLEEIEAELDKTAPISNEKEKPSLVMGLTPLPEFSMITRNGIEVFKDFMVQSFNKQEDAYTLSNGETTLTVTGETFKEINKPERYEKKYDENTPSYEKLIDSQYDSYYKQRENTADNFIHNLSVYCRKEANTPLDALMISREIISRMDKEEKEKTRQLLQQRARKDETINQVLINTYYEAVKGVPIDKDKLLQKDYEAVIAKPFADTISTAGAFVDRDSRLKIGDTLKNLAINVPKPFGLGKDKIYEDLTVISASKDGNNILLMDRNRSFYELPRDSVLAGYEKQQERMHKAEIKYQRRNSIEIER